MCIHVWNKEIISNKFNEKLNCNVKIYRETCIKCAKIKKERVYERDPNTRELPYFGKHLK